MQAKPVAWRWRYDQRFAWHIGILELSDGIRNIAEVDPLYSQSDFDAMRAKAFAAAVAAGNERIRAQNAEIQIATLQAQITRLREALKRIASGGTEVFDDDLKCLVEVSADAEELSEWARQSLSEPSPSNSGDTP